MAQQRGIHLHHDPGQQRPGLYRPQRRQPAGHRQPGPGLRRWRPTAWCSTSTLDLSGPPESYQDGGGHQPLLLEQRHPRRPLRLRLRREVGQLPVQQLRAERGQGRRPGAGRGPGRLRPQQRELRHAAGWLRAADADVRVARLRAEPARPSRASATFSGPMAGFGASLATTGPISGELVLANDGTAPDEQRLRAIPGRLVGRARSRSSTAAPARSSSR